MILSEYRVTTSLSTSLAMNMREAGWAPRPPNSSPTVPPLLLNHVMLWDESRIMRTLGGTEPLTNNSVSSARAPDARHRAAASVTIKTRTADLPIPNLPIWHTSGALEE